MGLIVAELAMATHPQRWRISEEAPRPEGKKKFAGWLIG
jgi:hypothetical protein